MSPTAHNVESFSAGPEIELLLACARARLTPEESARLRQLARGDVDWHALLTLALRHGAMPVLYLQLSEICPDVVPADFMAHLKDHYLLNAARNLRLAHELCRIHDLLLQNGVRAVPYKGPILACAVYGELSHRQFGDLDLLVRPSEMNRVAELLMAEGYERQWQLTPRQERAYLASDCERLFSRDGQIFIDVHWTAVRNYFPLKLALDRYRARLQPVPVESCSMQSFAPRDHLIILCVHAGKDFWSRLVWVCDIAELLRANPSLDWEAVIKESVETKTYRMLLLGLALAQHLLGASLPAQILRIIERDEAVRSLTLKIKSRLLTEGTRADDSLAEFGFYFRLMQGSLTKLNLTMRYWLTTNPADWEYLKLPDKLFFLYPLLRGWRLLRKHLR
jgi:hypothetical protein